MKNIFYGCLVLTLILIASCEEDRDDLLIVTTSDIVFEVEDNLMVGDTIGLVPATSNKGSVIFAITSQTPEGAFEIGENYGDLTVKDASLFDAEVNPQMTATISVTKEDIVKTSNITVNLTSALPCFEVDLSPWEGMLLVESDLDTRTITATASECGILVLSGVDPLAQFCELELEIEMQLIPDSLDPNIGTAIIAPFTYPCDVGFDVLNTQATGTYNISEGIFDMDFMDEFGTGSLTISIVDGSPIGIDNDGDGVLADDDEDDTDPCLPAQKEGYADFDASNDIWAMADCDGDGVNNGDEFINDTDPYGTGDMSCSTADISVWEGILTVEEEFFGDIFTTTVEGTSGDCGLLTLTGDLLNFDCDAEFFPDIEFTLTPESENATNGTVNAEQQLLTCFSVEPEDEFEATGTYDEETKIIVIDYILTTEGSDETTEGTITIKKE